MNRLSAIQSYIAIGTALFLTVASAWITHKVDLGTINGLKASYAEANAKAAIQGAEDQRKADAQSLKSATEEAFAQGKLQAKTLTITKWSVQYVKDVANCPDLDLLRVHDAAALGADPQSLIEPAGQSDGPGQVPTTSAFSERIAENYGACLANAQQLRSLQDWVRGVYIK